MATAASVIISRVREMLVDPSGVRWSDASLLLWITDAQREIALFKPDATATHTTVTLATGTRQTLPDGANRLLRVVRNTSSDGSTPGRAVRAVGREILDAQEPDWHDATVTGEAAHTTIVKNYYYDQEEPTAYYVFPGVSGNAYVDIVYSAIPDVVDETTDELEVSDLYLNAVVDYVLYRAYNRESEYATNREKASQHYSLFMTTVTGKSQLDAITGPNTRRGMNSNG